ncbi:MAG TPA: glycosyltransferase [Verrucomicrobiae bacterium]|nr:glycosyltransferase [Verrucomicrobiae bacterium]
MPSYNRAHLISEALDSVFAQTFSDYEVILVDDGSTDGTEDLVKKRYGGRLTYVKQENRGISGARNRGIESSRGKYIAFLDSDDKWLPEKLARQAAYMEAHPGVGLLATKLVRYEIGGRQEETRQICPPDFPRGFLDLLTGKNFVPTTTTMVRRECLDTVGVFDPELKVAEDWDLWLRIARRYEIFCLDEVLAEHRDHPQKTTQNLFKVYDGYWRFYEKMLRLYGKEIPDLKGYRRRGVSFEYLLGCEYLRHSKMRPAFRHIKGAVMKDFAVGMYFQKGKGAGRKVMGFFKPYFALVVSVVGIVVSLLRLPQNRR